MAKSIYSFSQEQIKDMQLMFKQNYTQEQIGQKYGVSRHVIMKYVKGVIRFYQDKQWLVNQYVNKKQTKRQIANLARCNEDLIAKYMKQYDISTNENISRRRKYTYNYDYFETIDTEDKAYWLGFIMADGNIRYKQDKTSEIRLSMCLSVKDEKHLKKFLKSLKSNAKIYVNNVFLEVTQKYYTMSTLKIYSKKIVEDLMSHNVLPNKTLNEKRPIGLPDNLIRHFIRGYFDGDGCFSFYNDKNDNLRNSFCIVSGYEIINYMKERIEQELNVNLSLSVQNGNLYCLSSGSKNIVCKIMDWLYKDSKIYLDRKYEKYSFYNEYDNFKQSFSNAN